jgi:hypothetical protein
MTMRTSPTDPARSLSSPRPDGPSCWHSHACTLESPTTSIFGSRCQSSITLKVLEPDERIILFNVVGAAYSASDEHANGVIWIQSCLFVPMSANERYPEILPALLVRRARALPNIRAPARIELLRWIFQLAASGRSSGLSIIASMRSFPGLGPIIATTSRRSLRCDVILRTQPLTKSDPGALTRESCLKSSIAVAHLRHPVPANGGSEGSVRCDRLATGYGVLLDRTYPGPEHTSPPSKSQISRPP